MYIYIYMYIYICVYIHMYVYIYMFLFEICFPFFFLGGGLWLSSQALVGTAHSLVGPEAWHSDGCRV